LQAIKALEFDQVDDIIRQAAPTLQDAIMLLPEAEQPQAMAVMQAGMQVLEAQAAAAASPAESAGPVAPAAPPPSTMQPEAAL
jgi:hypothetical protein